MEKVWLIAKVIGAVIAVVFGIIRLRRLFRPVRIEPAVSILLDGSGPDEIRATITNLSREALYIVSCIARPTYPLNIIIRRHIRNPFTHPRLYNTIRYTAQSFSLLDNEPRKIEPYERIELSHRRSSLQQAVFLAPMFLIEIELSTGRRFRSQRLHAPKKWLFQKHEK